MPNGVATILAEVETSGGRRHIKIIREHFEDPRRNNRSYRACSLLVFIAMALFAGRDTLTSIQRYGNLLTSRQRLWLGFPLKKGTKIRKVPSWHALYNFLTQIEPKAFAQCLNSWLESNLGTLPRALAIDGKWIRDRALSLCLSEHETGAPVAVGFAAEVSKTDENKREGEQTIALELYGKTNLQGAAVTNRIFASWLEILRYLLQGLFSYHLSANVVASGAIKFFLASFEFKSFE